jgi:RNA polymerase sigma factor (sigma-70 family)
LRFLKTIYGGGKTDKQLVAAFKENGDIRYLSELYQRYMELVFGVCLKYLRDGEKSKDAVMDIFEELNRKLKQHEVDNFKAWLQVLARNYCLMQLRTPKNLQTSEFNPEFMQSAAQDHLENEVLEREAGFERLEDCLGQLAPDQKQAIELFFVQKKCYNEIAGLTGFEWNKVRSHIQNGKRNLKICLEEKQAAVDR